MPQGRSRLEPIWIESPSWILATPVKSAACASAGKKTGKKIGMNNNAMAGRNFMRMQLRRLQWNRFGIAADCGADAAKAPAARDDGCFQLNATSAAAG